MISKQIGKLFKREGNKGRKRVKKEEKEGKEKKKKRNEEKSGKKDKWRKKACTKSRGMMGKKIILPLRFWEAFSNRTW